MELFPWRPIYQRRSNVREHELPYPYTQPHWLSAAFYINAHFPFNHHPHKQSIVPRPDRKYTYRCKCTCKPEAPGHKNWINSRWARGNVALYPLLLIRLLNKHCEPEHRPDMRYNPHPGGVTVQIYRSSEKVSSSISDSAEARSCCSA